VLATTTEPFAAARRSISLMSIFSSSWIRFGLPHGHPALPTRHAFHTVNARPTRAGRHGRSECAPLPAHGVRCLATRCRARRGGPRPRPFPGPAANPGQHPRPGPLAQERFPQRLLRPCPALGEVPQGAEARARGRPMTRGLRPWRVHHTAAACDAWASAPPDLGYSRSIRLYGFRQPGKKGA
jgi:hypothetical protein